MPDLLRAFLIITLQNELPQISYLSSANNSNIQYIIHITGKKLFPPSQPFAHYIV